VVLCRQMSPRVVFVLGVTFIYLPLFDENLEECFLHLSRSVSFVILALSLSLSLFLARHAFLCADTLRFACCVALRGGSCNRIKIKFKTCMCELGLSNRKSRKACKNRQCLEGDARYKNARTK